METPTGGETERGMEGGGRGEESGGGEREREEVGG